MSGSSSRITRILILLITLPPMTEEMHWTLFNAATGYKVWHQATRHCQTMFETELQILHRVQPLAAILYFVKDGLHPEHGRP